MDIRNICIIAHVDHGKTTLVDHLLRQAGTALEQDGSEDRVMDSMDLERERGITILAKNASIMIGNTKVNIVDTPGHADFGGEVERIMGMVDGALLLVDAAEGPLPQTRFVLQKALAAGHRVILVINKVDRPDVTPERIEEVINGTFDLFVDLGAKDEQADFPIVFAVARQGWATLERSDIAPLLTGEKKADLKILFDLILKEIPPPKVQDAGGFQMMVANLGYSDYVGQLAIGRILSGEIRRNVPMLRRGEGPTGPLTEKFTTTRVYTFKGMQQVEAEVLGAGDIGIISGSENFQIGDTIASNEAVPVLPRIRVEKPTLAMIFSINTSPLSGQEGEAIQSRVLRDLLLRECRRNVALRFEESGSADHFRLLGRGELQFGILIEQMRRAGYEFMVGRPAVLFQEDENGQRLEPMERVVLDLPEVFSGEVTDMLQRRKGILSSYESLAVLSDGSQRVRLTFEIPTRGLLGIQSQYLTVTRGQGLYSSELVGYTPYKGEIAHRNVGALVSDRDGEAIEYALRGLEDRGVLFIEPGARLYEGMIIGENARETDLNVNACREKKLTNVRASHAEVLVPLAGIRKMTLERCIEWIDDDEWIEVTPETIRMRKKILAKNLRSVRREDRIQ